MNLTPGQKQLLPWWGNIQNAVSRRASTADLWATVREAAAAEGVILRGVSAIDMNSLRSIAGSQRRSLDELQRAAPDQTITSVMIGADLSSRGQQFQNLAPSWIVRFEHDVTIEGQLNTLWRSSVFEGQLPTTKGQLLDAVTADAEALAEDYGVTHIGVGRMSIAAV